MIELGADDRIDTAVPATELPFCFYLELKNFENSRIASPFAKVFHLIQFAAVCQMLWLPPMSIE